MAGLGFELTSKFVRAHFINVSTTNANSLRWLHKLMYEFWGFCINGSNDLRVPGGFAPVSGVLFPTNWENGPSVLFASGSDGVTQDGMPFFVAPSVNWTSASLLNKWLVVWKSGSSCRDDSIYPITQIINSSTIRLDMNHGGTAYTGSLKPSFTARSNVNYRVIDFSGSTGLAGYTADADGLVLNLSGAYLVNSGQVTPQCRTRIRTAVGSNLPNVGLTLSSSGSWTPASSSGFFQDPTGELSATASASGWCNGSTGTGYITLIGAQDFLMCHMRGTWQTIGSGFHIEVPKRLYPQNNDPNPVTMMNFGVDSSWTNSTTRMYGGGFSAFHPIDGTTRLWRSQIRSLTGDHFNSAHYPSNVPQNIVNGRYNEAFFNVHLNKFMMFEMAMGRGTVLRDFNAMRFKLRRVRWIAPIVPQFQRIGDQGEWIHVINGILWPWDNAVLPYNLFVGGN